MLKIHGHDYVGRWKPVGQSFIRTREDAQVATLQPGRERSRAGALYQPGQWTIPDVEDPDALLRRCLADSQIAEEHSDSMLRKRLKATGEVSLPLSYTSLQGDMTATELLDKLAFEATCKDGVYLAPVHMIGAAHLMLARGRERCVSLTPSTFIEHAGICYGIAVSVCDRMLRYRLFQDTQELRQEADDVWLVGFSLL